MDLVAVMAPAWRTLEGVGHGFVASLPGIVAGLAVVGMAFGLGGLARRFTERAVARMVAEPGLGRALGRLARFVVVLVGLLVAAVLVFPGVRPADMLAFLGLWSVAVGFAFKDIFQNFLAGILILLRKPFRLGDQIRSGDMEGTVEDINLRAIVIKTYDGERAVIPNATVYTGSVLVRTAYGKRRLRLEVEIGYRSDPERAKAAIQGVLAATPGVLADPAPEVLAESLPPASVVLQAFFWSSPYQADVIQVRDRVAVGVKRALDAAGIENPFPVSRVFLRDDRD